MSCCGGNQGHNHGNHGDNGHNAGTFGSKVPLIIGAIILAGLLYYFLR